MNFSTQLASDGLCFMNDSSQEGFKDKEALIVISFDYLLKDVPLRQLQLS